MFESCLYFNVNSLARTVNRIWEDAFRPLDLSPAHAYLLRLVVAQPGLLQKEIAQELGLAPSTVTRFVDALEARGFVKRSQTGVADAREQKVLPTAKASRLGKRLESAGEELHDVVRDMLGDRKLQGLVKGMRDSRDKLGISE